MYLDQTLSPEQRAVLTEALSWLGTPWQHQQQCKGAGVDCAQFLIAVFVAAGIVEQITTDYYPPDWHLHRDEQKFMAYLLQHADPLEGNDPQPGDIAMWKYGRHAAHGSIVLKWPVIIHSWRDEGMVTITDTPHSPIADRLTGFYRVRGMQ